MADRSEPATSGPAPSQAREALVRAARDDLVRGGRHVTIAELVDRTGRSRDAARRWVARHRNAGRIIVVRSGRELLVPAFQLTAGGDIDLASAAVVELLTAGGMTGWAVWRWTETPNTWLGGAVPADVLQEDPTAVGRAAAALFQ